MKKLFKESDYYCYNEHNTCDEEQCDCENHGGKLPWQEENDAFGEDRCPADYQ